MTQPVEVFGDATHPSAGDSSTMVFVRTLGAASIDAGAVHLTPSSTRKFSLFFFLWAERGRSVTRATLHDMIFPDQPSPKAKHSIRELVYQLRKLGARIASDDETVELAPESVRADYSDVLRQERPGIEYLRAAEGGFMPGYSPSHSEAFTEWLEGFRGRATSELSRVFGAELNRAKRVSDWTLAEAAARAVLALDPLHEEATLSIAEMLAIGGAKAQAVRLLDRYIADVGSASSDLRVPATILRRRISEHSREIYRPPLTLPFLGRDAEMSALQERFARARAGEAQCVVLVGEAGIGKTRLAEELCVQAVLAGACVERVATQPHDTHRPMAAFADLVPKLLQLPGALGCSPESMAALRRLTTNDSTGASGPSEENSEVVAASISRALADLLDSIAGEAPLVVLVDDAQWTDERSRQTVASLTAARHARRLLIVLTSRDRSVAQFMAQRSERSLGVSLAPLTDRSAQELTSRALSDIDSADAHLQAWVAATSGGNPFFLKCLIGHFRTTGERFVVPTSLSVLLDQKIAALSHHAVALLGTCVALGRHSELERVLRALEMPQIALQLAAAELEAAHLVVQVGPRLAPSHSLVADAATRLASPVVQRLIHRRVAMVLEAEAEPSGSSVLLWDCAEHWTMAGEPERAADFLQRCASRAVEIGRPREAAELLLRAGTMVGREPAVQLTRHAVEIAGAAHESDTVLRGVATLRQLGVQIELDRLELLELQSLTSSWNDPRHLRKRLYAWLVSDAPLRERVIAGICLLILAEADGHTESAARVHDVLVNNLPDLDRCGETPTLTLLLIYHCAFGDLDRVLPIVGRLQTLAAAASPVAAADLHRKCAVGLWRLGRVQESIAEFRAWYTIAQRAGMRTAQVDAAASLMTLQHDFELAAGENWLDIMDALVAEDAELTVRASNVVARLDRACCVGDPVAARRWLESARQIALDNRLLRLHRWVATATLRIRQLEGDLPSIEEARSVVANHRVNGEFGEVSDLEIAVAYTALEARGAGESAGTMLNDYLSIHRRARSPYGLLLRRILDHRRKNGGLVLAATTEP